MSGRDGSGPMGQGKGTGGGRGNCVAGQRKNGNGQRAGLRQNSQARGILRGGGRLMNTPKGNSRDQ
ncbi:MAG TPA: hypothetical protein PKV15_01525 [Syntrophomonadaceae bacterium]|nr:hypothetical protein [Syntrophomonadaceae bacterium]HRX22058.1 hypothetical protein [Syntrophomonadaceae bacterium]